MRLFILISFAIFFGACRAENPANNSNANVKPAATTAAAAANANKSVSTTENQIPVYTYEIVNTFKHDPKAFTEGLFFRDGFLYESTGSSEGKTDLRKTELETGKIVEQQKYAKDYFGEGATMLNGKIYQLTWQDGKALVYDAQSLKFLKEFDYTEDEGWGLTTDGTNLIASSGNHIIKFIDPETFKTVRSITVLQNGNKPLFLINELEYIKGEIWANIWHSEETETGTTQGRLPNIGKPNTIVRIDPNTGKILGWVDLAGISPTDVAGEDKRENTLNGIAYDAAADRIFVTGKNWKNLFEIKVKLKQ